MALSQEMATCGHRAAAGCLDPAIRRPDAAAQLVPRNPILLPAREATRQRDWMIGAAGAAATARRCARAGATDRHICALHTSPRHLLGVVPLLPFLEEPPAEVHGVDRAERLEDADDHWFR